MSCPYHKHGTEKRHSRKSWSMQLFLDFCEQELVENYPGNKWVNCHSRLSKSCIHEKPSEVKICDIILSLIKLDKCGLDVSAKYCVRALADCEECLDISLAYQSRGKNQTALLPSCGAPPPPTTQEGVPRSQP